jgi:hypothetical protein
MPLEIERNPRTLISAQNQKQLKTSANLSYNIKDFVREKKVG